MWFWNVHGGSLLFGEFTLCSPQQSGCSVGHQRGLGSWALLSVALGSALPISAPDAGGQAKGGLPSLMQRLLHSVGHVSDSSSLGHGKGSVCGFTNSAEQAAEQGVGNDMEKKKKI